MSLRRVLEQVRGAPRTTAEIAATLNRPTGVVDGMLRTLARGGYLEPVTAACPGCPIRDACTSACDEHAVYQLTARGELTLREARPGAVR